MDLAWKEIAAIVALRTIDPVLYESLVILGSGQVQREDTEPTEETLARRHRDVTGYVRSAFFGYCAICLEPVITFPDGRKIEWPTLHFHKDCEDASDTVQGRRRIVRG